MNLDRALKLGVQLGVTPVITPAVKQMQQKGAGGLAALVQLDGHKFEHAYIAAMIKGPRRDREAVDGHAGSRRRPPREGDSAAGGGEAHH